MGKTTETIAGVDELKIECRILIGKTEGTAAWGTSL
jgi:hypothetical protein